MVRTCLPASVILKAIACGEGIRRFRRGLVPFASLIGLITAPASAADKHRTRLVNCGIESCLKVTGYREAPETLVMINGRRVRVEGETNWSLRIPLETVRAWTEPNARTIRVALQDPATRQSQSADVELPIGLLGDQSVLDSIVVTAH